MKIFSTFIALVFVLSISTSISAKELNTVLGYKDLKFGMSMDDIDKLGVCKLLISQQGLYKCYGKLINLYEEPAFKAPLMSNGKLTQIAVGLGEFKTSIAAEYNELLTKKYGIESSYTDEDIQNFSNNKLKTLDTIYAKGAVVMTIYHDGQGGMLLDILYNDSKIAKSYFKKANPKKATIDDI